MGAQFPSLSTALIAKAKVVAVLVSPMFQRNDSVSPASLIAGTGSVEIMEWFVPVLANANSSRTSLMLWPTSSSYLATEKQNNNDSTVFKSGCSFLLFC